MVLSIEDVKQAGTDVKDRNEVEDELMSMLSAKAYTGKEVADFLNITQQGAISKLNKLVSKGFLVKKRCDGVNHYYVDE